MAELLEQANQVLAEAVAFYRAHGCPCAYPRFRQLAAFDFRAFGTGPVGWHLQEILVSLATFGDEPPYRPRGPWVGPARGFTCSTCGTETSVIAEEFSINMQMTRMEFPDAIKARRRGLKPGLVPVPQNGGFFAFAAADIEKCRRTLTLDGTFEELARYLKAMDLTWPVPAA